MHCYVLLLCCCETSHWLVAISALSFRTAVAHQLLKKGGLDVSQVNYRPVLNLPFLSYYSEPYTPYLRKKLTNLFFCAMLVKYVPEETLNKTNQKTAHLGTYLKYVLTLPSETSSGMSSRPSVLTCTFL